MGSLRYTKKDGVLLIVVDEERLVDDLTLQDVQKELLGLLAQGEKRIVLDLERVSFVASAALGVLVRIRKRCGEGQILLKLCGVGPTIDETFRITGLNALFETYPTAEAAIASFDT